MNKNLFFYILIFLGFVVLLFNSCDQPIDESNNATSIVSINLGIASGDSIKAFAPPNDSILESIELRASGSDMGIITESYAPDVSSIIVEVPSGNNRTFELTFHLLPDSPSAVLTWQGSASADLQPNEIVSVSMSMSVAQTKLLIPDQLNQSIVMINDISGSYWKRRDEDDLNLVDTLGMDIGEFRPSDIDIDSAGDIYFANFSSGQNALVIRLNDIDDNVPEIAMSIDALSIAIDRVNNYLYCATANELYRKELSDPSNYPWSVTLSDIIDDDISGIAVMENGDVLLSASRYDSGELYQVRISGSQATLSVELISSYVTSLYSIAGTDAASDVIIKDSFIYLSYDYQGGFNGPLKTIVQLPLVDNIGTLSGIDEVTFGYYIYPPNKFAELNGPVGFIKGIYEGISFIDESSALDDYDRLVFIDNINTTTWGLFGSTGPSVNQFRFFNAY